MKTLLIICSIAMLFAVGTAQAQQYEVAPCGTKDFTTTADVVPGGIICLDIYLTDAGFLQNAGGVWIDFSGSTDDIALVSAGRCMVSGSEGCTGPWTNGAGANIPNPVGAGTHVLLVSSIGVPTDGDGDLIVGTVTLQNTGPNDAIVNFTTNPAVSIWTPLDDSDVTSGAIVISQVCYCTIDADCGDDGIGCTDEICDEGTCVSIPNDSNCPDDGMFCKGTEFCDAALDCSSTGDPCDEGENCDEENDVCVLENLPPDCSAASADPSELWSPNHKYVDIAIIDVTDADGDPVTITIDAIAQDEEVNALGMGDGNTSPDGTGVGTDTAFIMSERQGTGNGRVYEISFTAEDGNGAVCSSSVQVCVPHGKRRGNECIDDGQIYDSTDE